MLSLTVLLTMHVLTCSHTPYGLHTLVSSHMHTSRLIWTHVMCAHPHKTWRSYKLYASVRVASP